MQAVADKIGDEVEALSIELQAPPRIRTIDNATVPRTSDDKVRLTMIELLASCAFFAALYGVAWIRVARVRAAVPAGDASEYDASNASGPGG